MSFNKLPLELKEKIVEIDPYNYVKFATVSREWRNYIYHSKRIMQRMQKELDKFYFFFIVWTLGTSQHSLIRVFPISTEEELIYLLQHGETDTSQVGALKRTTGWEICLFRVRRFRTDFYSSSYTQDLILSIKNNGLKGLGLYLSTLPVDWSARSFRPVVGPPLLFSDKTMIKLLKGEHYVVTGAWNLEEDLDDLLYTTSKNYNEMIAIKNKIENTIDIETKISSLETEMSELEADLRECKARAWEFTQRLLPRERFAENPYETKAKQFKIRIRSLKSELFKCSRIKGIQTVRFTRSLFKPRWGKSMRIMELTPAGYEHLLTKYIYGVLDGLY